jgi:glycosyltransferase involved in cell wall biosynthesis
MRVLLTAEGLWSDTGGGQSLYRDWIADSLEIEFFALAPVDQIDAVRQHSSLRVTWIPLDRVHRDGVRERPLENMAAQPIGSMSGMEDIVTLHFDIAAAVAGMHFDVVDVPDYLPLGGLIPSAIRSFGATFDRHAISVHGALSESIAGGWVPGVDPSTIRRCEAWHYAAADVRYGISETYLAARDRIAQTHSVVLDLPVRRITPKLDANLMDASMGAQRGPDLCFVGRQEKWKGPDLFVEFASRLPRGLFSSVRIVGPAVGAGDRSSQDRLHDMARGRQLSVAFESVSHDRIDDWYRTGRKIVMLPSRHDSFNLVSLEALFSGCPIVLSRDTGAADYLKKHLPTLPFVEFDPDDIMSSFAAVEELGNKYDDKRAELYAALVALPRPGRPAVQLGDAYSSAGSGDAGVRRSLDALWDLVADAIRGWMLGAYQYVGEQSREAFSEILEADALHGLSKHFTLEQVRDTLELRSAAGWLCSGGVRGLGSVETIAPRLANGLNRAGLYRWLGHEADDRGDALHCATYLTRAMRLSGTYPAADLKLTQSALMELGMREEAVVLDIIAQGSESDMFDYLTARRTAFARGPKGRGRTLVDTRTRVRPKVSIIVSLYNASSQLETFLRELSLLTERSRSLVELVFVDSGSPDNTAQVLSELLKTKYSAFQTLAISTKDRETIQRAWNRGIELARGEYLAFLGADETVRADAFDVMADYLDEHDDVDWVQGDAMVTNVNDAGSFIEDVFVYHRILQDPFVYLLDTCMVGHVGALYRRSIHTRFGLYDDAFIGAGDTEFKNRVLPMLNVATIPQLLGTYLNYATDRMTSSAKVELEDIRAWHAFRTPGGIRYTMEHSGADNLDGLLDQCFAHTKSYNGTVSTDIELAVAIGDHLSNAGRHSSVQGFKRASMWHLREAARNVDDAMDILPFAGLTGAFDILDQLRLGWSHLKLGRSLAESPDQLYLFNDNRWQQHNWIWQGSLPTSSESPTAGSAAAPAAKPASLPEADRELAAELAAIRDVAAIDAKGVLGPENFDDEYYLALYPDVAEAIAAGIFIGGWEHFDKFGRAEDRKARPGTRTIAPKPSASRRALGRLSGRKPAGKAS